jgi:membrane protease YdiL (CAAX protease family)
MNMIKIWIEGHPLTAFFGLSYLFSWGIAFPLVAQTQGWITQSLPFSLHYFTGYGPLLSALIVTGATRGRAGLKEYLSSVIKVRGVPVWVWLAAVAPLVIFFAFIYLSVMFGGAEPDFMKIGQVNFLPDLGFFGGLLLWIFTSGLGEEGGWRGFALPELQKKRSALSSAIILSLFWSGWHAMAFFYVPTYMKLGLAVLPGFFIGIISGSLLLTWLFNSSKGSVLPSIIWHGVFNLVTATTISEGVPAAIISAATIIWAVMILIFFNPKDLATVRRSNK